jgi:hypothetical protein
VERCRGARAAHHGEALTHGRLTSPHGRPGVLPRTKVICLQNILRLLVYLAVDAYLSPANADPIRRARLKQRSLARLSAKISEKNPDGTWTSGPNAKIGSNRQNFSETLKVGGGSNIPKICGRRGSLPAARRQIRRLDAL